MRLNHKVIRRTKGYGRHSREPRSNLPKQKDRPVFFKGPVHLQQLPKGKIAQLMEIWQANNSWSI